MKTKIFRRSFGMVALLGLCFALTGKAVLAAGGDTSSDRVTVTWAPADQLSEVRDNPAKRGLLRSEDWMKTLGDYLRTRADRALPPGQQLQVSIDDIKLAGAFEPWRRPDAQDIRYMTDLYPPRLDLHYKLTSSDGTLIRESGGKLRDSAYLQHTLPGSSNDALSYDKRLIDDWIRREFRQKP